jgi:hypothetical protein
MITGPGVKTVLELSRFIPGWGGITGMASDAIGAYSDLTSIPANDTGEMVSDLVLIRSIATIANGALGHLLYVNQLVQDGLAGSVVGAEFTPLTAGMNETLSAVKLTLSSFTGFTDILVEAQAMYGRDHATSPAEAEQWNKLIQGYAANIVGDVVSIVMDTISLASAGAANTGPAQETARIFNTTGAILNNWVPNLIALLQGVWAAWGPDIMRLLGAGAAGPTAPAGTGGAPGGAPGTGGAPATGTGGTGAAPVQRLGTGAENPSVVRLIAEAVAFDAAGAVVESTAPQARAAYDTINATIDALAAYMAQKMAEVDAVVLAIGDGRTSFEYIRDAVANSIDVLTAKLSSVTELVGIAGNAQTMAGEIRAQCDEATGKIDSIQMPSVTIPAAPDLGEGFLADSAEWLANQATGAANAALEAMMETVRSALDSAKTEMKQPILDMKGKADYWGEFLANVVTIGNDQIVLINGHLTTFSEGLAKTTDVEGVLNLIIAQVSSITGMPQFTVQDLRDIWGRVGVAIDDYAAMGPQLHQSAVVARRQAAAAAASATGEGEAAPEMVAPGAGPPEGEGEPV